MRGDAVNKYEVHATGNNIQVGDGNVQNITYSYILQQLAQRIEEAEMPEEEKAGLWEAVKKLAAHPLTQTAISVGASILGA